jgi:hypothetical protein
MCTVKRIGQVLRSQIHALQDSQTRSLKVVGQRIRIIKVLPFSTSTSTPTHTTATHPTVLTINVAPNPVVRGQMVTVSGLLLNTLSSSGVGGATIKFIGPPGRLVTSPDGSFSTSFTAATTGRSTIEAHYAGAGIYEPSDSVKITLYVT